MNERGVGLNRIASIRARPRRYALAFGLAALAACGGTDAPPPQATAPAPVCGNGVQEVGEECDDGNASNADGCLTTCQRPVTWVTSDVHVHSTGCSRYANPYELADQLKAQQIQVGAALVWGEGYQDDAIFFTGRDHPLSSASFILHYDLEVSHFQAAKTGHLVLLGLDSIVFSPDVFYRSQLRRARRRLGAPAAACGRRDGPRVSSGRATGAFRFHRAAAACRGMLVVHAARGRLDFLSMERMPEEEPGTFRLWKALQNAGLRVAIAGGSDWSCLADRFHERTPRTDVIVEEPADLRELAAVDQGRTHGGRRRASAIDSTSGSRAAVSARRWRSPLRQR